MSKLYNPVITQQPQPMWLAADTQNLGFLSNVHNLVIRQEMSMLEVLTDLNALFKYVLWNGDTGEKLFFGWEEDSGCCTRNCHKNNREFNMNFQNEHGQVLFSLEKARSIPAVGACCTCCCLCCKPMHTACFGYSDRWTHLIVKLHGQPEFEVAQVYHPCGHQIYEITDLRVGAKVLTVTYLGMCPNPFCCDDKVFDVSDQYGEVVGHMTKVFAGGEINCTSLCREGHVSTFALDFGRMDIRQKVALIGATLLIEFANYQGQENQ
jgi:hypothetical protein